ncbi:MAG: hypothetical protein ACUVV0_08210 [Anaerolineae bacterium]
MESWRKFCQLPEQDRERIAKELIGRVETGLRESLQAALDESVPRKVQSVTVVVRSNWGETHLHTFTELKQAIKFMEAFDEKRDLDTSGAPALLME